MNEHVSEPPEPSGAHPLRRNGDFARLWTGGAVSGLGSSMSALAYPLVALSITDSATAAGLLGLVSMSVGAVLRLPAGVAVDRAPLRWMLIGSDLLRAIATAIAAVLLWSGHLVLWQLLVVAAVNAAGAVVNDVAHSVALRHVVPSAQLPQAFALNEGRGHAVSLAGQPIGGVLYGVAAVLPLIADVVSFTVSAGLSATVRHPLTSPAERRPRRRDQPQRSVTQDLLSGLRFLWRQPFLRTALFAAAGYQFVFAAAVFALIVTLTAAGVSPSRIGLLFAIAALGGILGAVAAPVIQRRLSLKSCVIVMGWLATTAFAAFTWVDNPLVAGVLLGFVFVVSAPANATLLAAQIQQTPADLQGRVIAASYLIAGLAAPLGPVLSGILLDHVGAMLTFTAIASVTAVVTVAIQVNRTALRP